MNTYTREAFIARTIEEHSERMDYGRNTGECECGGMYTPTGRQPKRGPQVVPWTPEHQAHEVAAILDAAEELGLLKANTEYEYAWEADEEIRQTLNPRGPRFLLDGMPHTPEELARFPRGRRVKRVKASEWIDAEEGE